MLKVVDLTNLTRDGQCLIVLGSRLIIVFHGLLDVVKKLRVQKIADDYEPGTTLPSFAMNGDDWVFQEHLFDDCKLLICEILAMAMLIKAVLDIMPLLSHSLQEEEDVDADLENGSRRTNIMISERVFGIGELWNH